MDVRDGVPGGLRLCIAVQKPAIQPRSAAAAASDCAAPAQVEHQLPCRWAARSTAALAMKRSG